MTDDTTHPTFTPPPAMGDEAMRRFFDESNAARQHIADSAMAAELDELGDYLLSRSEAMQAVSTMSEPAREDAIGIARDILRKLKIGFGAMNLLDGLGLRSAEDGALFGSLRDVVQIYEHMVAWACGIDASILNDPSIKAAIAAIGKLGYLAKRESLRLAKQSNLALLANRLMTQLASLDKQFGAAKDHVGDLLETIERGMNRVLNRVTSVSVSGAAVSHAQEQHGFMSQAPTAGMARNLGAELGGNRDAVGKRNTETLMAEEAAHQAEAARIQAQNAARAKRDKTTAPSRPAAANGRQALQQARAAQRRQQATVINNIHHPEVPPAAAMSAARLTGLHHAEEEAQHHEHDVHMQQQLQVQRQAAQRAAQRAAMQRAVTKVGTPTPSTPNVKHGHGGHHAHQEHADLSHAMETAPSVEGAPHMHTHIAEAATSEPALTTKSTPAQAATHAMKGIDLKGLDLKAFDMSGINSAPVATSRAELAQQLASNDPDKLLPPLPPTQNKGLVR